MSSVTNTCVILTRSSLDEQSSLSDDLLISESFLACSAAPWVDVHLQHFFYYHQHFLYYYPWNEIRVFSSPHVLHMSVYRNTCVHIWENNIRALHCCNMKLKKGFTASAALLFKRSGSFSCLLLVLWCCSFTNAHSKAASHFFVRLHQQVEVGGPLDLHSQESDWHLWLYNIHKSLQRPFCDITVKGLWRQQEDHPHLNYTAHLWLNNINLRLV